MFPLFEHNIFIKKRNRSVVIIKKTVREKKVRVRNARDLAFIDRDSIIEIIRANR